MSKNNKKESNRLAKAGYFLLATTVFLSCSLVTFAASMDEELIKAAKNNDIEEINALISNGANVNFTGDFLVTPLITAARYGNTQCVKALLEAGANVNAKSWLGCTPLVWSSENGHAETVKALIEKDADLEAADEYGWTPLMKATYRNHLEIVKILVANGADVNAKNKAGNSVLFIGEELHRKPEIIQLLVQAGAIK